jgi:hypothetical protein
MDSALFLAMRLIISVAIVGFQGSDRSKYSPSFNPNLYHGDTC